MTDIARPRVGADLAVEWSDEADGTVLRLAGEFDLLGVETFEAAAAGSPVGSRLSVDLRDLDFCDSSGLRCLMNLDLRGRREGWRLELVAPKPHVRRVLRLCGFDDRMTIIG